MVLSGAIGVALSANTKLSTMEVSSSPVFCVPAGESDWDAVIAGL